MKIRILVAVICVPVLFIVIFFLPPYVFAGVIALICAISAYELMHSVGNCGNERITIYVVFAAALTPVGAYFGVSMLVFLAVLLCLMVFTFAEAIFAFGKRRPVKLVHIMIALLGGSLIPLMLSTLVSMRNMPEGRLIVLLPVVSAFMTDGGSYFTGVTLGKRRILPLVSPKKTVEGFIGGLCVGMAAILVYGAVLVGVTMHYIYFWALLLYGFIGSVMTQLGDLAFSLIKREFEIKDYGRILPGHGGILDRFDSMVFVAPAMYLLATVVPAIIVR